MMYSYLKARNSASSVKAKRGEGLQGEVLEVGEEEKSRNLRERKRDP